MSNLADIVIPAAAPISVADIVVPSRPPSPAGSYAALRELLDACGPNKNDRAIVLIGACIGDGVATKGKIVSVGARFGLNPRHVAAILDQDTGTNPERHRWQRDGKGNYSLLN
jgi:AraC-like DNA-binding protein